MQTVFRYANHQCTDNIDLRGRGTTRHTGITKDNVKQTMQMTQKNGTIAGKALWSCFSRCCKYEQH